MTQARFQMNRYGVTPIDWRKAGELVFVRPVSMAMPVDQIGHQRQDQDATGTVILPLSIGKTTTPLLSKPIDIDAAARLH